MTYKFPCGCEIEVHDEAIKPNDNLPSLSIDYYNLPDCKATWKLIQTGRTKGIFQLESNLGRKWAKQLAPSNLEEMSALISLIRPGCLRAIVDGKSMTEHYCDRKNCGAEVKYFHNALEPILKETYGVLVYQEQSMKIAQSIAGFNLQEADVLRKAIGKKKADIMAKVKGGFLEGCHNMEAINDEQATEIFGWIQESQRYSFNDDRYLHSLFYLQADFWKYVFDIYKQSDEIYFQIQSMGVGNKDFYLNTTALAE